MCPIELKGDGSESDTAEFARIFKTATPVMIVARDKRGAQLVALFDEKGYKRPGEWGIGLADVLRHIAKWFEERGVMSKEEAALEIWQLLQAEMHEPTADVETAFLSGEEGEADGDGDGGGGEAEAETEDEDEDEDEDGEDEGCGLVSADEPDEEESLDWAIGMSPQEDGTGLWLICTHGLAKYDSPEFLIKDVPPVLVTGAARLLNGLGSYVRKNGPVIKDKQTYSHGRFVHCRFEADTFGDSEVLRVEPDERFYDTARCAKCGVPLGGENDGPMGPGGEA